MSTARHMTLLAVLGVVGTLDLDVIRKATAGRPLPSDFTVDSPAPDLTFGCQGSIAGTWMITDVSAESAASSSPRCPGRRIDGLTGSGTLVLNADGTFSDTTVLTVQSTSFVPTSFHAPSCALLEAQIAARGRIRSVSCTDDVAGACACAMRINPPPSRYRFTGRYRVAGPSQSTAGRCVAPNVMKSKRTGEPGEYVLTLSKVES